MTDMPVPTPSTIGPWSEVKLAILKEYMAAYSKILSNQSKPSFRRIYVDAFAGTGMHLSRTSGEQVKGSPLNALGVVPPFHEYHFIDIEEQEVISLQEMTKDRRNVHIHLGDCNKILLKDVLPRCRFRDFRRSLWFLDPYGTNLTWQVIAKAAKERSIEVFLNFSIMDINRNVALKDFDKITSERRAHMTAFWGDGSWEELLFPPQEDMFGDVYKERADADALTPAFKKRLKEVAGFSYVPEPTPIFRSNTNAPLYRIFFASQNEAAQRIVKDIFNKYRAGDQIDGSKLLD